MIKAIVCADNSWAIGKNNDLLYNIKEDMRMFKSITTNHGDGGIVVMGENTLLSLPNQKPLPKRINIVLCKDDHKYDGFICIHDFNELVRILKLISKVYDVYVIGGGMLYRSLLPYYDEVFVTKVNNIDLEAVVFFPNLDENSDFELSFKSSDSTEEGFPYTYNFCIYKRIGGKN
jgi:dihydrofolate reductase